MHSFRLCPRNLNFISKPPGKDNLDRRKEKDKAEKEKKRRQNEKRERVVGLVCLLAFANVYNSLLAGRGPLSAINEGAAFAFFTTKITHTHIHTHTYTHK